MKYVHNISHIRMRTPDFSGAQKQFEVELIKNNLGNIINKYRAHFTKRIASEKGKYCPPRISAPLKIIVSYTKKGMYRGKEIDVFTNFRDAETYHIGTPIRLIDETDGIFNSTTSSDLDLPKLMEDWRRILNEDKGK